MFKLLSLYFLERVPSVSTTHPKFRADGLRFRTLESVVPFDGDFTAVFGGRTPMKSEIGWK